jgi:hypothetical protein
MVADMAASFSLRSAAVAGFAALVLDAQTLDQLRQGFLRPPQDAKIMMRWWWFGPALTRADVDRDLANMKQGGIGGVEVQPVYPLSLEGNYPFLSDPFIDLLRYTRARTAAMDLRMDLTLGSGWPFGGPGVGVGQAAGRLRIERIAVPAMANHVKAPALADGEELIACFAGGKQIGSLNEVLDKPQAQAVQAFISSRTGMMVKRPSVGAEGFVLDHYDRAALDQYLKTTGARLMEAFRDQPPRAVFSDSLEVFASDWTPDFLKEFHRRRGYDLTPHLPALASDAGPETGAVRNDWAKTLAELCAERYLKPMNDWAHAHRTLFRSQTYGVPPVTLASQAIVDLPEGEKPNWRAFTTSRWATSAAHLFNKPVVSSETWTWLHSPAFRATPLDMKAEADLHFLQGVTQLVGHGWPSSPEKAGEPGYRFYAAAVFNHHNPWWIVMPDIAAYLQRVSWLLRQGEPANDVALYLPTADARARFTPGNVSIDRQFEAGFAVGPVIPPILDAGYNFDFIDDDSIEAVGIPHPVLVLPGVERMSAAASRRIAEYRAKGGKVIAVNRLPDKAPGLREPPPVMLDLPVTGDLPAALRTALSPDLKAAPGIGFIHRRTPAADIYFVANTTNRPLPAQVQFRARGNTQVWDPVTGAPVSNASAEFAPYESRVYIVGNLPAPGTAAPGQRENVPLDFAGGSWPEYFSGVRSYTATFNRPAGKTFLLDFGPGTPVEGNQGNRPGMRAWLESPVREAAVVWVNGARAGSVWKPPFELDITGFLKAGENHIRLEVANTAINRLAGESLPNYRLLNLRYGERFQPQDMENLRPLPSGLTGSVHLRVEK